MTNLLTRVTVAATTVAVTLGLAGCSHTNRNVSDRVCVTRVTHQRVDDYRCDGNESLLYSWWYLQQGQFIPAVGQRATVGSLNRPRGDIRLAPTAGRTPTTKKPAPTTKKPDLKKKSDSGSKSKSGSKSGGSKSGGSRSGGARR